MLSTLKLASSLALYYLILHGSSSAIKFICKSFIDSSVLEGHSSPSRENEYGEACNDQPSAGAVASVSSTAGHTLAAETAAMSHCSLTDLITRLCTDPAHSRQYQALSVCSLTRDFSSWSSEFNPCLGLHFRPFIPLAQGQYRQVQRLPRLQVLR